MTPETIPYGYTVSVLFFLLLWNIRPQSAAIPSNRATAHNSVISNRLNP